LLLIQLPSFLVSSIITTSGGNYNVLAQSEDEDENNNTNMSMMKEDNIISPLTEWVGIFALGITLGLVSPLKYMSGYSKNASIRIAKISAAILSMSAGIIHLLLIQEHMEESILWGIFFLISGIAQIIFGIFILVRLFTPPFSIESAPINELEPNGIITIIIEILSIVVLAYLIKSYSKSQRIQKVIH